MNGIKRGLQITLDYYHWLLKHLPESPELEPIKAWVDDLMAIKGAVRSVKGKLTIQDAAALALLFGDPFKNSREVTRQTMGQ